MNDYCTITIDGSDGGTYYVPCNQAEYITRDFINVSSSTINLYQNIRTNNDVAYISMPSLGRPVYHSPSSYNTHYITDVTTVQFNRTADFYREYDIAYLLVLCGVLLFSLCNFFLRRHS